MEVLLLLKSVFQNHVGGRETNFQHGEDYKEQIIAYWEARDYDLIRDSSDDNTTADLVFRKTFENGSEDLLVESKYSTVSRTDDDFLTEVARYFIRFQESPDSFELHFFVRELSALTKWRHIFDSSIQKDDRVSDYFERVVSADVRDEETEKLEAYTEENFKTFVSKCKVHQAGYEVLKMATERLEDSSKYDRDTFTKEREPINEGAELEPNFARISSLPEKIYIADIDVSAFDKGIKRRIGWEGPYLFKRNQVYTIAPPESIPGYLRHAIHVDSISSEDFSKWGENHAQEAKLLLLKEVCRGVLSKKYTCKYDKNEPDSLSEFRESCQHLQYNGDHYLLFEHPDTERKRQYVGDRLVTRVFDDGDSFVRHRAAQIGLKRFDGEYLLTIQVKYLFTKTGGKMTLIRGYQSDRLHDAFNQNQYTNKQAYGEYKHWRDILSINKSSTTDTGDQEMAYTQVKPLSLRKRPPEDIEEAEQRDTDSQQSQLGNF